MLCERVLVAEILFSGGHGVLWRRSRSSLSRREAQRGPGHAQPTIDLDESIAALAARAHVSAHNKDMLQDKMLQQGVGNVAELLTAIQGGTSATALGFSPAALALCERVLPDKTLRSTEAAAAALAAAFASLWARARAKEEEPEPGEDWEGEERPEEYAGLFDDP